MATDSLSHDSMVQGISSLVTAFEESDLEKKFETGQTTFHHALNRFQKAIERTVPPTIPQMSFDNVQLESENMLSLVADYFLHTGRIEIAQQLKTFSDSEVLPYQELVALRASLKAREVEPILFWLRGLPETDEILELTFTLRKLHYGNLIRSKSSSEALDYAREWFTPYMETYRPEMQKLLGALAFLPSIEEPGYIGLVGSTVLAKAEDMLTQLFCRANGLPADPHLLTLVRASTHALPNLSKAKALTSSMGKTSVAIELPKDFIFHSTFCCPVSKELSSPSNPPQLLPCGHVLSKDIIHDLSRGNISYRRTPPTDMPHPFKCPYCPEKVQVSQVKTLCFD